MKNVDCKELIQTGGFSARQECLRSNQRDGFGEKSGEMRQLISKVKSELPRDDLRRCTGLVGSEFLCSRGQVISKKN